METLTTTRAVKTAIATFLVASVTVLSPTVSLAAPENSGTRPLPATAMLESDDAQRQKAIDAAADQLTSLPHEAEADMNKAQVSQPEGSDVLMVAVQLSGDGYDEGSFAGIVVDPATWQTTDSVQVRATHSSSSTADVTTWLNGEFVGTKTVEVGDSSTDRQSLAAKGADPDVVDCLNALGISTMVAVIIISTCGAACAVTVGAGCIACVAGFTAIGGASVGKCLST